MKKNAYSRFIEHLGSRVLSLPDSESLFPMVEAALTPEEAEFLSTFPFTLHSLEQIAEKFDKSAEDLKPELDALAERGVLFWRQSEERVEYALNEPWFIFYRSSYWAGKKDERTQNIAINANRYYHSGMGQEFGGYPTMTLRAIPIHRTVEDTRQILPHENIAEFIQNEEYICVGHCPCRQMKNLDPDTPSCKHETLNCLHLIPFFCQGFSPPQNGLSSVLMAWEGHISAHFLHATQNFVIPASIGFVSASGRSVSVTMTVLMLVPYWGLTNMPALPNSPIPDITPNPTRRPTDSVLPP